MTVEGEKDDITGTGQCRAAHDLCTGIRAGAKKSTSNVRRSAITASSTARASAPRLRPAWPSSCARTIPAPAPISPLRSSSTWRPCRDAAAGRSELEGLAFSFRCRVKRAHALVKSAR